MTVAVKGKIARMQRFLLLICFKICKFYIEKKWQLLRFYYERLMRQANFIYRQSDLFKIRWQELGMEFAEKSFEGDIRFFFWKARQEPFKIRWQLFLDGLLNREPQVYYCHKEK